MKLCLLLLFVHGCVIASAALADSGKLTIRVKDAASGEAMAARLVLRTADGKYPGDRLAASAQQWPHIEAHAVFIDGDATFELPAGKMTITAAHGLEYQAESQATDVEAGQTQNIELRLKRVVDMRRAGWVAAICMCT